MTGKQDDKERPRKGMMRMDVEGWRSQGALRTLVEPRSFRMDDAGRPVAMTADIDDKRGHSKRAANRPFLLEEPEPEPD